MNRLAVVAAAALALAPVLAAQFAITPDGPALNTGVRGVAYSVTFEVFFGGPVTWTTENGLLPAGLSLNPSTGALSGTPTQTGTFGFTVRARSGFSTVAQPYSLKINEPLTIGTTSPLQTAYVDSFYVASLEASGGDTSGDYSWSFQGVSSPTNGLTFDNSGFIYGTVTAPATTLTFNVTVTDRATPPQSATRLVVLPVVASSLGVYPFHGETVVGRSYVDALVPVGGNGPYSWTFSPATAPPGLTFAPDGQITGTPTQAGIFNYDVTVRDGASQQATSRISIVIYNVLSVTTAAALPTATRGQPYTTAVQASGGRTPYYWDTGITPPTTVAPGVLFDSDGSLSGAPTQTGTFNFLAQVYDSGGEVVGQSTEQGFTVRVFDPLTMTSASLPSGMVGAAYPGYTFTAAGGESPYTYSFIESGVPGLTLASNGTLSGTPTTPGFFPLQVQVTDTRAAGPRVATFQFEIQIAPQPLVITSASPLPQATTNSSYNYQFMAAGGIQPYFWVVESGQLPPGMTLSSSGLLTGTPTAVGSYTFLIIVSDYVATFSNEAASIRRTAASRNRAFAEASFTLQVVAPAINISTNSPLPNAVTGRAYSQAFAANPAATTLSWTITQGTPPPGLAMSPAGVLAGTPTSPGSYDFTVAVNNSANSAQTSRPFRLVVLPVLTILTPSPLPTLEVGMQTSLALQAQGGSQPYRWTQVSGSLPGGITLSESGVLSGMPSAGRYTFAVRVADQSNQTATREYIIDVEEGSTPLEIITTSMPEGMAGRAYGAGFEARGGVRPYTWTIAGLPPGMTGDASGGVGGTPRRPGTYTISVQVSDERNTRASGTFTLVIKPGTIIIEPSTAREGAVGTPYSIQFSASGGIGPYRFALAGAPPAGLAFAEGLLSGTPTEPGTFSFSVEATDDIQQRGQRTYTLVIQPGRLQILTSSLPDGQVSLAYSGGVSAIGGTQPYTFSISGGSLPAGLSLSPQTGAITGMPSAPGGASVTVQVTDEKGQTDSRSFSFTIRPALLISGSLPSQGEVGMPLAGSLTASGGLEPYKWSISAGSPPPGVAFSDGSLSGTPTAPGTYSFTVQVTDGAQAIATSAASIEITGSLTITTASLPDGVAGSAYSQTLSATGGARPYTWSASGLPAGLTVASDGTISGTPSAAGSFSLSVTVTDASQPASSTSRTIGLQIGVPALSNLAIDGLPQVPAPGQQPGLTVSIGTPFPAEIRGTLTLAFAPDAVNNADDPSIQFSTGGRTVAFTIPAGSTQAAFQAPTVAIQTGTVAGTITLSTSMISGGAPVNCNCPLSRTIEIPRTVPVITSVRANRTATGLNVVVTGYSTTREVTQGHFRFGGNNLQGGDATVGLTSAMNNWFQGTQSGSFGGQFVLTVPFTIQGDTSAVNSVTVTLGNSIGNSQPGSANF